MNGRALSEKAIEVSPSSNRVLDRAAEVLTPFPPSKNRPRPGDWTCPSCGFSNFQRRTACFRCSYPAMSGGPQGGDPNMGYSPYGYPSGQPPMVTPHHYGHGQSGGRGGNSLGGSAPFRPGDWRCGQPDCLYHNFAKNVSCLRCGSSRANALTVSEGPHFNYNVHHNHGGGSEMGHPNAGFAPGPAHMNGPAGFPSNTGGFPGGPAGFGPPSSYALPSGLGGPNTYGPMTTSYPPNGMQGGTGFGSRSAADAFTNIDNTGPGAAQGGPPGQQGGYANGGPGAFDGGNTDPFGFLGTGIGSLSLDDNRRNGAVGHGQVGKSPV
jgi:Zn-finger in Ran binding protein and others